MIGKPANGRRVSSPAELFGSRVVKHSGCWGWSGSKNDNGYGCVRLGGRGGKSTLAHRLSWELHHGPIPDGMQVLHRCDNPGCTNPEHLFLGTNEDNIRDRMRKGRPGSQAWRDAGERHPNAKLTDEQCAQIRALRAAGGKCSDLAKQFNVCARHISVVSRGIVRAKW